MDFTLTAEEELFRKTVATFVEKEVILVADELEKKGEFPSALFKRAGELGYFGLRYPTKYGGTETNTLMFSILCEELARGWMSLAMITAMQSLMGTNFIYRFGTENHKKQLLVPAIRGEKIAAFALTCPKPSTIFTDAEGVDAIISLGTYMGGPELHLSAPDRIIGVESDKMAGELTREISQIKGATSLIGNAKLMTVRY